MSRGTTGTGDRNHLPADEGNGRARRVSGASGKAGLEEMEGL